MKLISFILLIAFGITLSQSCYAQDSVEDTSKVAYVPMNKVQLAKYRKSIWDSLPGAVGWVNDFEGLFSIEQENNLQSLITHFEKRTTIEIMVVTIDTNMVAIEDLNNFSYRMLKIWGIGKRLKENGIIICISNGYHALKITCDFGIYDLMDESEKNRIIGKYFIPSYKKNRYYEGTYKGLNAIMAQLSKRMKSLGGDEIVF